jgi:hypothetical protein
MLDKPMTSPNDQIVALPDEVRTYLKSQYEQEHGFSRHLDQMYMTITSVYLAICGAYLSLFSKLGQVDLRHKVGASISFSLLGFCVVMAIWRCRILFITREKLIQELEQKLDMLTLRRRKLSTWSLLELRVSFWMQVAVTTLTVCVIFATWL